MGKAQKKSGKILSRVTRRTAFISALVLIAVITVGVGLLWRWGGWNEERPGMGADNVKHGKYLLTIDGYGVAEEEFRLFLNDERALTASYFYQKYGAHVDTAFWHQEYDGQTPLEYAKSMALDKLLAAKVEFILADERGLREFIDLNGLLREMNAANTEREKKIAAGETVYGLAAYDAFTYYSYVRSSLWTDLVASQENLTDVTDEQLEIIYDENIDLFDKGFEFTYEIHYGNGTTETVTMTLDEVGKEDYESMALLELFSDMEEGERTGEQQYRGGNADIMLISKKPLGAESFINIRNYLRRSYAEQELRELIARRVDTAVIEIDQEYFDHIEF